MPGQRDAMKTDRRGAQAAEANDLSEMIWPLVASLLAGKAPEVQGAVLADLIAVWLSGPLIVGDKRATARLRRQRFDAHCRVVWKLVAYYDAAREQGG